MFNKVVLEVREAKETLDVFKDSQDQLVKYSVNLLGIYLKSFYYYNKAKVFS